MELGSFPFLVGIPLKENWRDMQAVKCCCGNTGLCSLTGLTK